MTDNEIMSIDKAIRHCYETYLERDDLCKECREEHKQLAKWLEELKASRDIINRQKAEIKKLQKENYLLSENADTAFQDGLNEAQELYALQVEGEAKSEAIKEFAERLKTYATELPIGDNISWLVLGVGIVDQLAKEMTGK